jgi:hypothetical protein
MLEQWKAAKGEYPADFQNSPEVYPWLRWYLAAWDDLGRSRPVGYGIGPIPASEILAYCNLLQIEWQDVRDELFYFCGVLDDVYVPWAQKTKDEEKEEFLCEQREKLKEAGYGDC